MMQTCRAFWASFGHLLSERSQILFVIGDISYSTEYSTALPQPVLSN